MSKEEKKPEVAEEGICEMCGNVDTLRLRYGSKLCRDCERSAKGMGR